MPFDIVDSAADVDGSVLVLCKDDGVWEVRIDEHLLMAEDDHTSEDALASLALARLPPRPRVLIGGLGLGFTLRAALDLVAKDAVVVVVERCAPLVGWNREHTGHLAGHPLRDPRVELVVDDVVAVIKGAVDEYDAIVLDVDNGPEALVHDDNAGLYGHQGLVEARRALKSGGVYAVWSCCADDAFAARVKAAGFSAAEAVAVDDAEYAGEAHVVFLGVKP